VVDALAHLGVKHIDMPIAPWKVWQILKRERRGQLRMAMQIEKDLQVKEPIDTVWNLLSDPRRVANCVPGAKITEQVDEKTYEGTITVKVGPSTTDYKGKLEIVRLDAENHEIEILGKGQDMKGRGSASMRMTGKARSLDEGGTEVTSVSEVNVVGMLAQMGSRVIAEVSNIIFAQFTKNFQAQLQQPAEAATAEAKPISAASVAWAAAKGAFHRDS
jgi:carbon monoxide dehydrogenase subunit G